MSPPRRPPRSHRASLGSALHVGQAPVGAEDPARAFTTVAIWVRVSPWITLTYLRPTGPNSAHRQTTRTTGLENGPVADGEVPEADSIEQAIPAEPLGRAREHRGDRPEADEADWIDQGIVEDRDDERPDS